MICSDCYHKIGCSRKPTPDDRCDYYIKGSGIELDDGLEVNPIDTLEYDYDEIKKLIKDIDPDLLDTLSDKK
jgi:hypothetical protein